jgi:phospholipid/cholesterol/gamma-HCH transport system substrate-binding protein
VATKRQAIEVGVFLTVCFAVLGIVLVALAGFRTEHLNPYHITFEESISGLTVGSKVTYRGVPIGKVIDLLVSKENLIAVTIGVDPRKVTLREGVKAKYSMETIFGPFTIDLSEGKQDARALDPGESLPVVKSLLSGVEREVPGILEDIRQVATQLRDIVKAIQPEQVGDIVAKTRAVLDNANAGITEVRAEAKGVATATQKAVDEALAELKKANETLTPSLQKLQETVGKLNEMLTTANQVVAENREALKSSMKAIDSIAQKLNQQLTGLDVPALAKNVEESARKVGAAAESVGKASDALAQGRQEVSRSIEGVERSLLRSLDELEQVLRVARSLIETLERDPSALLRGKRREPEGDAR